MKKYVFYDTDITGQEEYDIAGEDYRELIQICCKYCTIVSLRITHAETSFVNELEKYRIPKDKNITFVYKHYYGISSKNPTEVKFYRICPELYELLLKISESVFKWIYGWGYTNPEDPAFYRSDGSVFFSSIIHEGECTLTPINGENISKIIEKGHWISSDM